jgi:hypothetical protein
MNKYIKLLENGSINWKELQSFLDELNEELKLIGNFTVAIEPFLEYVCIFTDTQYVSKKIAISDMLVDTGNILDFGSLRDEVYAAVISCLYAKKSYIDDTIITVETKITDAKQLRKKFGVRMET